MYAGYQEAVEMIVEVLRGTSKVQLDATELVHVRRMLDRALRADTGGTLTRLDFLTREKLIDALRGTGFKSISAAIEVLYPKTMQVIEVYS